MKYSKPTLAELGSSIKAIQHVGKPSINTDNACPTDNNATAAAYEADE